MPDIINQILVLSSLLFAVSIAAMISNGNSAILKKGLIITYLACVLNFSAFSNFTSVSAEGSVISIVVLLIQLMHLFIQTKLEHHD